MANLIKPLIRNHFYATETTYGRNRVYFYSKDAWQRMRGRMMAAMCAVSLRHPVASLEKYSGGAVADLDTMLLHSKLRFIPKPDGSRPIMSTTFRDTTDVNMTRLLLQAISSQYREGMELINEKSFVCVL